MKLVLKMKCEKCNHTCEVITDYKVSGVCPECKENGLRVESMSDISEK